MTSKSKRPHRKKSRRPQSKKSTRTSTRKSIKGTTKRRRSRRRSKRRRAGPIGRGILATAASVGTLSLLYSLLRPRITKEVDELSRTAAKGASESVLGHGGSIDKFQKRTMSNKKWQCTIMRNVENMVNNLNLSLPFGQKVEAKISKDYCDDTEQNQTQVLLVNDRYKKK